MLFELGTIVATRGVTKEMGHGEFHDFALSCLFQRHANGDWGNMCEEDKKMNDEAVKSNADRIFSSYDLPEDVYVEGEKKLWIITEWDRSVTTLLFPSEY